MRTLLQSNRLVLVPENEEEREALASWRAAHDDFAFAMQPNAGTGATLVGLGPRQEACREPINVTSASPDPIRLIANFAPAPFDLDGVRYACVEAFWQSLRFPADRRAEIAGLDGAAAKRRSEDAPYGSHVAYGGMIHSGRRLRTLGADAARLPGQVRTECRCTRRAGDR